ncbi:MAG: DNA methyltransferase [Anaerolineales bacterium]|jgi:DNA modification methylase
MRIGISTRFEYEKFWGVDPGVEAKMHRIHAYPAKFPAFITPKAIEYARHEGVNVEIIADIFCGCGTTALEANKLGINFWGCDINPIATLIARTKSKKYKSEKLETYKNQIMEEFTNIDVKQYDLEKMNSRIRYWYEKNQIIDLLKLKKSIEAVLPKNSHYKSFFLCAFSNILKSTSKWLTKSIKPQIDPYKKPADVVYAFNEHYKFMYSANEENVYTKCSKSEIIEGNILKMKFKKSFVDLLITSPPYVTSYEYADLHQLSTLWLQVVDDYRELRKGTIGSVFSKYDYIKGDKSIIEPGDKIVDRLDKVDTGKAKAVYKYFKDMQEVTNKCFSMVNPGGMVFFVIGNTEYKGVQIHNSEHLLNSLAYAGFKNLKKIKRKIYNKNLPPYRDEIGRFTTDKTKRKIYSEEFIVVGRKPCEQPRNLF